mmetsp:Transcript_23548/g.29679  ORF Transcript_23548/g.29679 Transcript_23548/m.29679 type:complete len:99 (-) Transcript_23548:237-533(-)|eukprot:CAMPEP_0203659548 /NCGR_PEP_ID=MMETSP0088-20131115/52477_1 /ASSEMBLY_ACC=CAM_ASM_001087 /TAXON_ID=426623 /ORGANISM="Chaetoceros affinis, Strain CCMP159" /LENGTH=98 /DNA_ID=CAMNT_0050521613 /DNA_START=65 /DNA_END=361 /DNA_ORIENTATION=+
MTYSSRGRSVFEVILAVCFVGFLVGFITVLCIGNYFRAKRAQERQRQRRIAKLSGAAGNSNGGRSSRDAQGYSSSLGGDNEQGYEAPDPNMRNGGVTA